jgi:thiamine biosynthesis lipoprotein
MRTRRVQRFRAMGCEILVGGASDLERGAIERLFAERERTFSRFVSDSELNRVNHAAGRPVRVSASFAAMLELALAAARDTGGLVDPTLGAALVAAGYNADFDSLVDESDAPPAIALGNWRSVRLFGRYVLAPCGTMLDLNGVVKGQTVDNALSLLSGEGFVSAGGDLATRGATVVALPCSGAVRLVLGALATSGSDRRRWSRGGLVQHHLIDPSTGEPSTSPWRQVTACALTCVGADVAAKAAFLLGESGPDWLDAAGVPARFVAGDGSVQANERWRTTVERDPACI